MLFEENANFVFLWPRRSPRPGPWSLLASLMSLPLKCFPPYHKGLLPVPPLGPTCLRTLAQTGPPSSLGACSPQGQTDIRQVHTLLDLITTRRGTKKEEENFSRRRWPERADLKLEKEERDLWDEAIKLQVRDFE